MSRGVRPDTHQPGDSGVVLPGRQVARQPRSNLLREIIETVVLTAIVFFVVRAVAQPYRVDGPSMQPGLYSGDYVLVSPLAYAFGGSPQRGDVIVFHPPIDPTTNFIKRVIGVPGDVVSITPHSVYVNGKKLTEPYVNGQAQDLVPECEQVLTNIVVQPGTYLVLGDNRGNSEDSRCFGAVPRQNIEGKAVLLLLPLNQFHWINTYPSTFAGIPPAK